METDDRIVGDWMPPSPSPRSFFSSLLGDDAGAQAGEADDQTVKLNALSDQKTSSRGGLVERMAARAGFNAPRLNTEGIRPPAPLQNQGFRSPYLPSPFRLSPTTLLESPVFIYNSLVYPSPTTGLFPLGSGDESKNSTLIIEADDKRKETACGSNNSSCSSSFNPIMEADRVNSSSLSQQLFRQVEVSVHPDNSLQPLSMEETKIERIRYQTSDFPMSSTEMDVHISDTKPQARTSKVVGDGTELSPSRDEQQHEVAEQRADEDGYNWIKYEQKQVKGNEYPRSYYKCTYPNCPVKKKIERFHEGPVTRIIYDGAHNHPKPLPSQRSAFRSSYSFGDMQLDNVGPRGTSVMCEFALATIQQGSTARGLEWRNNDLEGNGSVTLHANGAQSLPTNSVDVLSTFSNDEDEDDHGTHGSASLGYDGGGRDESESKRRKIEPDATDKSGNNKAIKEPKVVVQTISEVDILDDGYRWRKYGQKVIKGHPNPRSYYKCTSVGCNVRKHVERASHDLKIVITTYEGKHNHDVPAPRNSTQVNSRIPNFLSNTITTNAQSQVHRPEPTPPENTTARYGRAPLIGSFSPTSEFNSLGTSQQGLAGLATTRLNSDQCKCPVPVHPYIGRPGPVNDAAFMHPRMWEPNRQ